MHSVLPNSKDYFFFNIMENIHWHKALTIHSCVRCYMYSSYPQIRQIGYIKTQGEYAQMYNHTKQIHLQQNFKGKHLILFLDFQNKECLLKKKKKNKKSHFISIQKI